MNENKEMEEMSEYITKSETSAPLTPEQTAIEGEARTKSPSDTVPATLAISDEYAKGDTSTGVPDSPQYRLSRPKRVIIRATLKHD